MLKTITSELKNAAKKLNSEKVIKASPIYLLPQKNSSNEPIRYSLEQLMIELDKHGIISEKDSAFIYLNAEHGSADIVNSVQPGLYDDSGKFKRTLEQWLGNIVQKYHVNQGIVLISFSEVKDILSDEIWSDQLFRHIRCFKNRFLFFFSFDESDLKDVKAWAGKSFFCETIELEEPGDDDYIDSVVMSLNQYGFTVNVKAVEKFSRILKRHRSDIDYSVLDIWQKQIAWSAITSSESNSSLNEKYILEDELVQIIENRKSDKSGVTMGFGSV